MRSVSRLRRILLFGANGQVGTALRMGCPAGICLVSHDRQSCNLLVPGEIEAAFAESDPIDAVINVAAYTNVDAAEDDEDICGRVNRDAAGLIASLASEKGAPLIHLSTDYVFDGFKEPPYSEDDAVNPLNVYGRSKSEGEALIRASANRHIILRTSWVYGVHGRNFVKTMIDLAAKGISLRIVGDQTGAPTSARQLSNVIYRILDTLFDGNDEPSRYGTFHYTDHGAINWHDFAACIFVESGLRADFRQVTSAEFGARALRPMNSLLDCQRILRVYGIEQADWRAELRDALEELRTRSGGAL